MLFDVESCSQHNHYHNIIESCLEPRRKTGFKCFNKWIKFQIVIHCTSLMLYQLALWGEDRNLSCNAEKCSQSYSRRISCLEKHLHIKKNLIIPYVDKNFNKNAHTNPNCVLFLFYLPVLGFFKESTWNILWGNKKFSKNHVFKTKNLYFYAQQLKIKPNMCILILSFCKQVPSKYVLVGLPSWFRQRSW